MRGAWPALAAWVLRASLAVAQDASAPVVDASVATVDAAASPPDPAPVPDPDDPSGATTAEDDAAARAVGPDDEAGAPEGGELPETAALAAEIAEMSPRTCLRALARAHVDYERPRSAPPGIETPVVVRGPIRGVTFRASDAPAGHELMDCRLAVSLARFATLLRALHVREVRHYSMVRGPSSREPLRDGLYPGHPGGMAIDAAVFVRDDGSVLDVLRDYRGRRGRPPCGARARVAATEPARTLRTIQCESARRGWFHVVLGPNFNVAHRNHLHLEVARGVCWLFVR